jgi:integrase
MRGEGRIFKVKGSRFWHFAFCYNGKEIRDTSGSENEDVARKKLGKALAQIDAGVFIGPKERRLKFEDMAVNLTNYYKIEGRASLKSLPYFLKHLRPVFGMDRARSITADRTRKYTADRLQDKAKPATINKELGVLKRMFTLAIGDELLPQASMPNIQLLTENNTRMGFVKPADFLRLRAALPDYLQDPVSFLYASTWRVGEMRTLQWDDVERDENDKRPVAIQLRAEVSKNRRGRTVMLEGDVLEIIKRASAARRLGCSHVFHHDGEPIGDFRKPWRRACQEAGLAGTLIHDLRRSGIRNAVRAGVHESVVMEISGHLTRSVFDRYDIKDNDELVDAALKVTAYNTRMSGAS